MTLKDKIITASLGLFSTNGFMSTSISDVMAASGASKGGLYNHFKSKDQLFYAALSEAQQIWREKNLDGLDDLDDPVDKVIRLFENYQHRYLTAKDLPGGCLFVNLAVELNDQRPDLAAEVNEGFVGLKTMVKRFLDAARKEGGLKGSVDTRSVTDMVVSGLLGACVMYTSDKSEENLNATIGTLVGYIDGLRA
jgi:TetR/AcrR family transcriptional repressor of nem operon